MGYEIQVPEDSDMEEVDEHAGDILNQQVLLKIHHDIGLITLPSWIEPPRNFGSLSHGKLKADQWRTATTIHLAISLVSQWGHMAPNTLQSLMLESFMNLAMAGELAARHRIDPIIIGEYKHYISQYLSGIRALHDKHKLKPNHHFSVHLAENLAFFGPAHRWWSFPFERYNGAISKINKNNKISMWLNIIFCSV